MENTRRSYIYAAKQKISLRWMPLHWAIYKGAPFEVVDTLLEVWPDAVKEKSGSGRTPLHAI